MRAELRLPIGVWVVTTLLVIAIALQIDAFVYVAVPYVGLNAAALWLGLYRSPPLSDRVARVLAWCTAAQLPTMLMLIFDVDGNRSPRKQLEREAKQRAEETPRDARPARSDGPPRSDRPSSQR